MSAENRSLERIDTGAMAVQGITLEAAFEAAVSKKLDKESLEVLQKLVAMSAEQKFNAAFVALQADLPTITASTMVKNRGAYEKFEDIMRVVGPILTKHGFTISFSNDFNDMRVIQVCHLSYGGHTRSNSFAVRVGRGDDATQQDLRAATSAKRLAVANALNLVIRQNTIDSPNNDAGLEGDPNAKVTAMQADELEHRAKMINADIPALLRYAKVNQFADIPARLYVELDALLKRKERSGR